MAGLMAMLAGVCNRHYRTTSTRTKKTMANKDRPLFTRLSAHATTLTCSFPRAVSGNGWCRRSLQRQSVSVSNEAKEISTSGRFAPGHLPFVLLDSTHFLAPSMMDLSLQSYKSSWKRSMPQFSCFSLLSITFLLHWHLRWNDSRLFQSGYLYGLP